MDYTVRVLRKCKEHGFKVLMDPHQDVVRYPSNFLPHLHHADFTNQWSRFSGGSGAPFWTLAACGIEPRNFTATQAAIVHSEYPTRDSPDPAKIPAMIWGTNYGRLASLTLFTFFFGGRAYAPKCVLDGKNIQDYLQEHFITAFGYLADRIASAGDLCDSCVIGWDSMNEPFEGLIGFPDVTKPSENQTSQLKKGTAPTPIESFRLGIGQPQTLDTWGFGQFGPKKDGRVTVDPKGVRMWAAPESEPGGVNKRWGWHRDPSWELGTCVWAAHGVWDPTTGEALQPEYFKHLPNEGRLADFVPDFWHPHLRAYANRVRVAHPEAILFVAPPVFHPPPPLDASDLRGRACYSTHYYDGLTLVTRHWNWFNADALGVLRGRYASPVLAVKIGETAIRKSIQEQLGELKRDAEILGEYPTLIGEIGTPFDMDGRAAYGYTDGGKRKGDYSAQQRALDASLNAADGPNGLNYTIWTYCPDSSHPWGDGWNMEDLSLWSPDDLRPRAREEAAMVASTATLVKKAPTKSWVREASGSTLSLATLSVSGGATIAELLRDSAAATDGPPEWDNLYDFLTDGARAVKAFARPYPVATFGTPVNIQFDIKKAEFKLTVRVRADDAPLAPGSARERSPAASSESVGSAKDEEELATEIYVPLVHFARDALVARFTGSGTDGYDGTATPRGHRLEPSDPADLGASASTLLPASAQGAPLALDVTVSEGKWDVEGQRLRWWYAAPAPGEEDREYEIVIKRRGGAIKTLEEKAVEQSNWCQDCVGQGCVVM